MVGDSSSNPCSKHVVSVIIILWTSLSIRLKLMKMVFKQPTTPLCGDLVIKHGLFIQCLHISVDSGLSGRVIMDES